MALTPTGAVMKFTVSESVRSQAGGNREDMGGGVCV